MAYIRARGGEITIPLDKVLLFKIREYHFDGKDGAILEAYLTDDLLPKLKFVYCKNDVKLALKRCKEILEDYAQSKYDIQDWDFGEYVLDIS